MIWRWNRALAVALARAVLDHLRILAFAVHWGARGVYVAANVRCYQDSRARILLGPGTRLGRGTIIAAHTAGRFDTVLQVGADTAINEYCNLRPAAGSIRIGQKCQIAQFVSIIATSHSFDGVESIYGSEWRSDSNSVEIGSDVWIGAHAVILSGVTIGDGAVIGAGAVVTRDVPSRAIAVGVPAKIARLRQLPSATQAAG